MFNFTSQPYRGNVYSIRNRCWLKVLACLKSTVLFKIIDFIKIAAMDFFWGEGVSGLESPFFVENFVKFANSIYFGVKQQILAWSLSFAGLATI